MSVMKNKDIKTLSNVWNSLNELYYAKKLSQEDTNILFEFSELMKKIVAEKENANEKAKIYISDKRKDDKNYARSKSK